jgi:CheY-like chemotaxis protein
MPRVLVIDDDPLVRATISVALKAKDFEVITAESGAAGLKYFEDSQFELVIVDIYMPAMDGAKIIKKLRARTPSLPIIAISGVFLNSSERTALDFFPMAPGFSDVICLRKPFRPEQLSQAIQRAIGVAA